MKSYRNLICAVMSPLDLTAREWGVQFLKLLDMHSPVRPTHIGNTEPVRQEYKTPSEALALWRDPFLWRNETTRTEGSVWFGHGSRHSCIYLRMKLREYDAIGLKSFFIDSCRLFKADFGYTHLMTEEEMGDKSIPHSISYAIDAGISTIDLKKCIPNVCWAMLFGKAYEGLGIQFENIRPPVIIERYRDTRQVNLQLTHNIKDLLTQYPIFEALRRQIKESLGPEYFCGYDQTAAIRSPTFEFGNDLPVHQ